MSKQKQPSPAIQAPHNEDINKRNYENKIKILGRQIISIVESSSEQGTFRKKFNLLPDKKKAHVFALMDLKKGYKASLNKIKQGLTPPAIKTKTRHHQEMNFSFFYTAFRAKKSEETSEEKSEEKTPSSFKGPKK